VSEAGLLEYLTAAGYRVVNADGESLTSREALEAYAVSDWFRDETPASPAVSELTGWWLRQAEAEARAVVPKAVEYGANSMIEVGRSMARLAKREVSDEEAIELAVMFYISGKLGRWIDAAAEGRRPSDDTIYDIAVYTRMAQRNRAVGSWPGVKL
jgi:hypothetical protein